MTLDEIKSGSRVSIRKVSGWVSRVNANAPIRGFKVEIIYTMKDGRRLVAGSGSSTSSMKNAENRAWDSAFIWFNED
jgi:hypothetical protein